MKHIIPTLHLGNDLDEARSAIAGAVESLLASGRSEPQMRIVLTGNSLPAALVSALITGLRKLREDGGAIELVADHEVTRAAIRLNGLDRVFALPLVPEDDVPARNRRRGGLARGFRAAAAGLAILAAAAGLTGRAQADELTAVTDPAAILSRVIERNPNLSSYQSRLHVDVHLTSFPFISQHLEGATYFKKPANYEVVFDRVPSYAKGFEKLYSDVGDPSNWDKRFVITYTGVQRFENRTDIELHLVQRVRGMIDHETVLIDPNAWTIDQIRYDYYNGGVVTMTQHFTTIAGCTMLASQHADIHIPHVRAVANGSYTDYQTNVAISDDVFTKKR